MEQWKLRPTFPFVLPYPPSQAVGCAGPPGRALRHYAVVHGPKKYCAVMDWVRKHPYLAMAAGYGLLFVFGTGIWFAARRDLTYALTTAFVWTSIYGAFAAFQIRRRRQAKVRLDDNGQIMIHLRYPDSRPGSLPNIWNQGIVTPAPGSLQFQPAVYDTLEPWGPATTIKVQEVFPERRKLNGQDRKYIQGYGLQALTLLSDDGKVEIAATPESLDRLSKVLISG